jgi:hypothetical protein
MAGEGFKDNIKNVVRVDTIWQGLRVPKFVVILQFKGLMGTRHADKLAKPTGKTQELKTPH